MRDSATGGCRRVHAGAAGSICFAWVSRGAPLPRGRRGRDAAVDNGHLAAASRESAWRSRGDLPEQTGGLGGKTITSAPVRAVLADACGPCGDGGRPHGELAEMLARPQYLALPATYS